MCSPQASVFEHVIPGGGAVLGGLAVVVKPLADGALLEEVCH